MLAAEGSGSANDHMARQALINQTENDAG